MGTVSGGPRSQIKALALVPAMPGASEMAVSAVVSFLLLLFNGLDVWGIF